MDPFGMTPPSEYKRENFFPCITEEYRRSVRDQLCIRTPEEQIEVSGYPPFDDTERDPFGCEKPNYDPDLYHPKPLQKGHHLDVFSLLSGGRQDGLLTRCVNEKDNPYEFDQVGLRDSLYNKKYVLIVCVFAPVKWSQDMTMSLCKLSSLSSELFSSQPHDFEMVIVAKMRQVACTGFDYDVDAFHQFLSAFPGRLAVPHSEAKVRDSVCLALGFEGNEIKAVLVGPDSTIWQDDVSCLIDYGAIGFPFTDDRLDALDEEETRKPSLPWLLNRDPSFRLHKFNNPHETESRSIEQLGEKLVGLYLFQRGDKLPLIRKAYNQCRDRDRDQGKEPEFEIVMICMPLYGSVHPIVFQEEVYSVLNRVDEDVSSWWVFPYDNSVCLRLWEMSREHADAEDSMIIVGPGNSFFDPCAGHMIRHFGILAYPFTREVIVQRYVERAEKVTLDSLLLPPYEPLPLNRKRKYESSTTCVVRGDGEQVPLSELHGKNVLFYLVDKQPFSESIFATMVDLYTKIKDIDPCFELVFVTGKEDSHVEGIPQIPKSWLVRRCEPEHLAYLMYGHESFYGGFSGVKFFNGLSSYPMLAFGKDGHIHSLDPLRLRLTQGYNAYPFDPVYKDLRRQIIRRISEDFEFMHGYENEGYECMDGDESESESVISDDFDVMDDDYEDESSEEESRFMNDYKVDISICYVN